MEVVFSKKSKKAEPLSWKIERLENIFSIQQGISKGKTFKNIDTIFHPYLRVVNVKDGYLELSEIKLIQLPAGDLAKYAIEKDDVLITKSGDPDKLRRGRIWEKNFGK